MNLVTDLLDQAVLSATRARLLAAMPLDDPEREHTAARVHVVVLRAQGFHPKNYDGPVAADSGRIGAATGQEGQ